MDLCHGLDFEHQIGQYPGCCFILSSHPGHIQQAGSQLEIILDPVMDLPERTSF
jgi:hypothetical protein